MTYGNFTAAGAQYVIHTPRTPARWFNYLFNDSYYMEVSQTGQGKSTVLSPRQREYNREGYKYFYIRDEESGQVWCPAYQPLKTPLDSYSCTHALGYTEIRSCFDGVKATIRTFVPLQGMCEIWTIALSNESGRDRRLSLFSVFSIENGGVMGSICQYHEKEQLLTSFSFPYHVFYEEKEKYDRHSNLVYLFADRQTESYDCSERRFFGGDDAGELPVTVARGSCFSQRGEADNPVGALHHRLTLASGGQERVTLALGCAGSWGEALEVKRQILAAGPEKLLEQVNRHWEELAGRFVVETPDEHLNYFMNHWLKKQIVLQTRTNRMSRYCPIRNQLQDALGYAMISPEEALGYMETVLARQEQSGFIQQWIMTDGSPPQKLCLLTHKDGPVWLVICLLALIDQAGDAKLLDREVGFKDSEHKSSIYDHLLLAIDYMANDTGAHGLCLMGHGDWNDPINGPGRLGRGESAWSTMALTYGIHALLPFCRLRGDDGTARRLERTAADLDRALNDSCWDGAWYVAGFDDAGAAFGTARDKEGQLFLNTQTWAVMSGAARGGRLDQCLEAIDSLDTPAGPLLLTPPFSEWNPKWGRISIKLAGTTENGSVYCHASMFKAFADCQAGRGSRAYETIRKTLPTNPDNPPEKNGQVPIFIPNFYYGLGDSPNFGQSSHHNSTGTVGWMLWTVLDYVLGIRATAAGLVIDPCIPCEWGSFKVSRIFRGARYIVHVSNPTGVERRVAWLRVDGQEWVGAVLPYEDGRTYAVEVELG
ncbi:MAG: hypothetical protein K0R57_1407 [Paenibacillaceae bacterium]|jgi:cellobiose phosphorylase/cellobionic acid phosphorylase|nr:hypothetical protein [Paenibacillaceae bacterium]